jgi:hypothetical protein
VAASVFCLFWYSSGSAAAVAIAVAVLQDLFQHNAWAVKVAGMEAADAARAKKVDFSAFYNKFGMDNDSNGKS